MKASLTPDSTPAPARRWFIPTSRERRWLLGLAVFILAAVICWKTARHELTMFLVLRSDAPSQAVLSDLADEATDRAKALERMWRSENLIARFFVMDYLNTRVHSEAELVGQMEAIVSEAVHDPDLDVRDLALNILAEQKRREYLPLLREQLIDADPAVRIIGLQRLQHLADSNDIPAAIRLLDDSDPRVVVSAGLLLRQITGQDFGLKLAQALPRFARLEGDPPPAPDVESIQHGVQRWHDWWKIHNSEFPQPAAGRTPAVSRLPAKNFHLENLEGRSVQLSDFRGRPVLLCFWKIGVAASFDDLAALKQLQQQYSQRLTVIGVAFSPAVGPQDEHEGHGSGHEHNHDHAHMAGPPRDAGAIKSAVRDLVTEMQINFPVFVDTQGNAVFRYNVQDIPTYVLIDADGFIRRRFIGSRQLPAWTAMLDESLRQSPD